LHSAQTDRREGESGVKAYDCRGVEQRGERHDRTLMAGGLDGEPWTPKRAWP
jgi:hypothetical protein